jgi:Ca2+-binding RTX toxin-like protein
MAVIYFNDFQTAAGAAWSNQTLSTTPTGGRNFLGEFANNTVSLNLNTQANSTVTLEFDLFILKSWDGASPENFTLSIAGGQTLLNTNFSNVPSTWQSYNNGPARSGAIENDTLGYGSGPWGDSVYRLQYTFQAPSNNLTINFAASGLQEIADESWGLDNVKVSSDSSDTDLSISTAVSYTLNSSQLDLALTGTANINGTGNSLNNTIFGNTGNNLLSGGAGADSLFGGAGNDTLMGGVGADSLTGGTGNDWYWIDNASDSVIELANEGTDKVYTTISYTLTDNVEDLALQETAASINGTGNSLNNTITDNTKNNVLDGAAGNDIIRASGGNDTLTGGLGTDTLTGGLGNDWFVYTNLTHSLLGGIDSIKDFNNSTESDRFVVNTARSVFNNVGVVSGLNATAIGNALTTSNFGADAAALFTIGSKSYVAINDGTAGFSAASDAIVDITGYKGTLSTSSFVTV